MAVEISARFDELVTQFVEAEHSRMPIYRETLDDPVGVVHVKDVFKMLADSARRPSADEPVLRRLRREALYVPGSMRAADLLVRMQTSRIHLALVIDEFGGTDGLVTLEDLVESVVGDIDDEHDETARAQVVARAGVFEADARAPLEELEQVIGESLAVEEIEEEVDTVGGLVSALAGRVPQRGEVINLAGRYDFEIVDADPRRVKRVRVRRVEPAPAAEPAEPAKRRRDRRRSLLPRIPDGADRPGRRRRRRPGPSSVRCPARPLGLRSAVVVDRTAANARTGPLRSAFWRGWLAGVAYFTIGVWWVTEAFMVDAEHQGWMAPFAIAFIAAGLGAFWGLAAMAYRAARPRGWTRVLVFAGALALMEYGCAAICSFPGTCRARPGRPGPASRSSPAWSAPMG